jgi:hypothetical protein
MSKSCKGALSALQASPKIGEYQFFYQSTSMYDDLLGEQYGSMLQKRTRNI